MGRTAAASVVYDVSCAVAAEAKPARSLGLPVSGDALLTFCTQTVDGANPSRVEHAFLPAAGFYFLLGETAERYTVRVRFDAVDFAS